MDDQESGGRRVQSSNPKRKFNPQNEQQEKIPFYDEEYKIMKQYWNDLGVTEDYKSYFEAYATEFQTKDRKDYFNFEINNLKKIHDNLSVKIELK